MSLLEGLDGEEVRERFRNQYFAILFVNWQVWPLFQVSLPRPVNGIPRRKSGTPPETRFRVPFPDVSEL